MRVAYTNKRHVGEKFAVKIISYKVMFYREEIENEINIHKKLSDRGTGCVPRFYSVCKAPNTENVLVRTELCDQNLLQFLKEKGGFLPENEARMIMKQILKGVRLMKKMEILHCDLKLENILVKDEKEFKICNFGASRRLRPGESTKHNILTLENAAPE